MNHSLRLQVIRGVYEADRFSGKLPRSGFVHGINITGRRLLQDLIVSQEFQLPEYQISNNLLGIFEGEYQRSKLFCDTKKKSRVRNTCFLDWISKCTITCNDG